MRVRRPALQVCQGSWQQRACKHTSALSAWHHCCECVRACGFVRAGSNCCIQILWPYWNFYRSDFKWLDRPRFLVTSHHSRSHISHILLAVCWQLRSFSSLSGAAMSVTSDWVRQIMWFASNFKGRSQTNVTPERVLSFPRWVHFNYKSGRGGRPQTNPSTCVITLTSLCATMFFVWSPVRSDGESSQRWNLPALM